MLQVQMPMSASVNIATVEKIRSWGLFTIAASEEHTLDCYREVGLYNRWSCVGSRARLCWRMYSCPHEHHLNIDSFSDVVEKSVKRFARASLRYSDNILQRIDDLDPTHALHRLMFRHKPWLVEIDYYAGSGLEEIVSDLSNASAFFLQYPLEGEIPCLLPQKICTLFCKIHEMLCQQARFLGIKRGREDSQCTHVEDNMADRTKLTREVSLSSKFEEYQYPAQKSSLHFSKLLKDQTGFRQAGSEHVLRCG